MRTEYPLEQPIRWDSFFFDPPIRPDSLICVPFVGSVHVCSKRQGLGLLGANRQIRSEAEKMFWENNTFCFDDILVFIEQTKKVQGLWCKVRSLSILYFHEEVEQDAKRLSSKMSQVMARMKRLRELEMQAPLLLHRCTDVLALKGLKTLRIIEIGRDWMAKGEPWAVRLWMGLPREFEVPKCDRVQHKQQCVGTGYKYSCRMCSSRMRSIQTQSRWLWLAADGPFNSDDSFSWARNVTAWLEEREVALGEGEMLTLPVRVRGWRETKGSTQARVWGLPTRPLPHHRKAWYEEQGRKQMEGKPLRKPVLRRHRPVEYVDEQESLDDFKIKERGVRSQHYLETRSEAGSDARKVERTKRRKEEARHEAARDKSLKKKLDQEKKRAIEQMEVQRKAARKRTGRH